MRTFKEEELYVNDQQIIEMYWNRDEQAIRSTADKYGSYCYAIAFGILHNEEDSKESVNDTYMNAWNRMPPDRPAVLKNFLGRLTRWISVDRWRKKTAGKRGGGELPQVLEELSECISKDGDPVGETEKKLLDETVGAFVKGLGDTEQRVFLSRYWYAESVKEIANRFCFSESKVKSMLMRTRKKLHERLVKEGLL